VYPIPQEYTYINPCALSKPGSRYTKPFAPPHRSIYVVYKLWFCTSYSLYKNIVQIITCTKLSQNSVQLFSVVWCLSRQEVPNDYYPLPDNSIVIHCRTIDTLLTCCLHILTFYVGYFKRLDVNFMVTNSNEAIRENINNT
jgi:hypothetical protein